MAEASIPHIEPRDDRMKGGFSCHSFTEQGRENYENMTWNSSKTPQWEETHRLQKRHQEISNEVEAMKTPKAHESAVEYRDVKEETTVPHSLGDLTARPSCKKFSGLKKRLSIQMPHLTEEEIEITAYDMGKE